MSSTIVVEIVTADGTAAWTNAWEGPGYRSFQATPPSSFDDWQAGPIDITIGHDGMVVGRIDYLEAGLGYGNGGMYGVGVVDVPFDVIDGQVMCSPEIRANALAETVNTIDWTKPGMRSTTKMVGTMNATRAELVAVALVDRTANLTTTKVRAWSGDYRDPHDRGLMKASWSARPPAIVDRAIDAAGYDLRHKRPSHIKINRPAAPTIDDIEVRKASTIGVRYAQRTIDLIAAPYNEPTEVVIRGKWVTEVIAPGAFDGVHGDVTVNRSHDLEQPLGKVIALHPDDPRGLRAELLISRTRDGDDVLELAADGLLSASVGFMTPPGGERWSPDQRSRTVTRAKLVHIALTGDPAYKGAQVLAVRQR